MSARMGRWVMGLMLLFVLAGALPVAADAQVVVVRSRRHHYRHHHRRPIVVVRRDR